jgi:heme exporter protein A
LNTVSTLSFQQLGCSKGGRTLFKNIDCVLEAGKWLYLTGPNGVGKTSLLRMVCGLAPTEMGEICWNGTPIAAQRDAYNGSLCYLGHLNALQESMTVNENLRFTAALSGRVLNTTQAKKVLQRFGVGSRGEQLVRHLSQGQKRRVSLCRLAMSPAQLWILDEPFVAMDDSGVKMLADLIADHLNDKGMAILTSHQQVPIGDIPAQLLELKTA